SDSSGSPGGTGVARELLMRMSRLEPQPSAAAATEPTLVRSRDTARTDSGPPAGSVLPGGSPAQIRPAPAATNPRTRDSPSAVVPSVISMFSPRGSQLSSRKFGSSLIEFSIAGGAAINTARPALSSLAVTRTAAGAAGTER